jgi:hypothetical protein
MFNHIFFTWLLSNLFHPVCLLLFLMTESPGFFTMDGIVLGLYFFPISIILSLPCLFIGWCCLFVISRSPNPVEIRFILWLLIAPSLAFVDCLVVLGLSGMMDKETLEFTIPAMIAASLAVLTRYSYFKRNFESHLKAQA